MKKAILLVVGTLAALYSALAGVQFIQAIVSNNLATGYGATEIAASVVPVCIGLVVAISCFQHALRNPA